MKYIKTEFRKFLESFKLKFDFVYVSLYELVFYTVMVVALQLAGVVMDRSTGNVNAGLLASQEVLMAASEPELAALYSQLKGLVVWMVVALVALVAIFLITLSFTRGKIYAKIMKKKFDKIYFRKLVGLNATLGFILLLVLIFISLLLKTQLASLVYLSLVALLAIAYFFVMIMIEFMKAKKVFVSIAKGLEVGAKKFKKLWLPILFVMIVGYLMNLLSYLLPDSIYIKLLILVVFLAWARIYFVKRAEA